MTTNSLPKSRALRVVWCDWAWHPEIIAQPLATNAPDFRESMAALPPSRNRLQAPRRANCRSPQNPSSRTRESRLAFTLVELLVVIGIIAILAAMLVPAVIRMQTKAKVTKAKLEIGKIVQAISGYESAYSRLPIASNSLQLVSAASTDFTFGSSSNGMDVTCAPGLASVRLNSEIIAIIMDLEKFGNGSNTVNFGHIKNTQKNKYLTAEFQSDTVSPGVGADGVFRDPWGSPYFISVDTNGDDKTRDSFYCRSAVSSQNRQTGFYGLFNAKDPAGTTDEFEVNGSVMVWSAGPDKKIDTGAHANEGDNKDNILSWKP